MSRVEVSVIHVTVEVYVIHVTGGGVIRVRGGGVIHVTGGGVSDGWRMFVSWLSSFPEKATAIVRADTLREYPQIKRLTQLQKTYTCPTSHSTDLITSGI